MTYTLYDFSLPVFIRGLENLRRVLKKAKRYATKKRVSESSLLSARLAPDMFALTKQVQYAYFMALETATNLSGEPMPKSFKYDEKTFADLDRTIKMAIVFLKSTKRSAYAGADKKKIVTFLDPKVKTRADAYAMTLAVPNFFFHTTTAYDILRHKGVPLIKDDYLGL